MQKLLLALAACALVAAPTFAEEGKGKGEAKAEVKAPKAINKYCPVTGKPVDEKALTVEVKVKQGEKEKAVLLAVADEASQKVVTDADEAGKALFVEAAKKQMMVKEGKLEKIEGVEPKGPKADAAPKGEGKAKAKKEEKH